MEPSEELEAVLESLERKEAELMKELKKNRFQQSKIRKELRGMNDRQQ